MNFLNKLSVYFYFLKKNCFYNVLMKQKLIVYSLTYLKVHTSIAFVEMQDSLDWL